MSLYSSNPWLPVFTVFPTWGQQLFLCPPFSYRSKESYWFFSLFSFLFVVRTERPLSSSLYANREPEVLYFHFYWPNYRIHLISFNGIPENLLHTVSIIIIFGCLCFPSDQVLFNKELCRFLNKKGFLKNLSLNV